MKIKSLDFDIKSMLKRSLPPTIISIILLPTLYIFFGISNILIAPYMALMYIRLREYTDIDKSHTKPLFLHLLIGVFATVAGINPLLTFSFNLILGVGLTYLLTDEYNPSSYFPYLFAFVLLQLIKTPIDKLYLRLLAIAFSYLVLYITLKLTSPKLISSKIIFLIDKGFLNISEQLKNLGDLNINLLHDFKYDLFSICRDMNRVIYFSQKSKYYSFVILFQHLNNITDELLKDKSLLKINKDYLFNLSRLFININLFNTLKDYDGAISEVNIFLENNKFSNDDLNNYFKFLLNYSKDIFVFLKTKKKTLNKEYLFVDFKKINHLDFNLNSFKLRFSLKMGILLSLSFTFVSIFNFQKSYWLPMTIFLLLMPFYEESRKKAIERFKGTFLGIVLCSILFFFFTSTTSHLILIALSTLLMYSLSNFTWLTTYVTCYAIGISTLSQASGDYRIIFLRLFYTSISVIIVLFFNRFILRNENFSELKNMINKLVEIDKKMVLEFKNILKGDYNPTKIREYIYLSYLISSKIQAHNNPNSSREELQKLREFILSNNKLTTLLSHESLLLYNSKNSLDLDFINEAIISIENILSVMELSFKGLSPHNYSLDLSPLKNHTYANIQMANCVFKSREVLTSLINLNQTLKEVA